MRVIGVVSLVDVARAAITARVLGHSPPGEPPVDGAPSRALFVTLYAADGGLRGCVGHLAPIEATLHQEVASTAVMAATEDPRFPELEAPELVGLRIEVDVLGPSEAVEGTDSLDPVRFGVVVSSGIRRGVVLPGVSGVDTVAQQLEVAMHRAGIGPLEPLRIERFEVERHR